jgi:tRNA threonylcarbamoyladenosine biosynthesis protein TsaE
MIIISKNSKETENIGKMLAQELKKIPIKKSAIATIIALEGNLGSGKTTFTKGIVKGLKIRKKITSPTFIILKEYKAQNFYHIDCYRLQKPKEILDLGFKEIISNPKNIVVIEWAERIRKILPKEKITVKFRFVDEYTRKLIIS